MKKHDLPEDFIRQCKSVTAKRPKTVIDHILKHGYITTEDLKEKYGYNHPPRAAGDVRESGIPLETFRITGTDGRKIGAYKFGNPRKARFSRLSGRTAFSKKLKEQLIEIHGCKCAFYMEIFDERELQIDHRVPFEVAGDHPKNENNPDDYILVSGSANRAKSWSCEHCENWINVKKVEVCKSCYWAYPENYNHIAMRPIRRIDIMWTEEEVEIYEKLKYKTLELHEDMPAYIKDLIAKNVNTP